MTDNKKPTPPSSGAGASSACGSVTPCPVNVTFHMHLDADRDGKVDDNRTGIDSWAWGKGNKGAVILCNNDADDGAPNLDNADNKVNGGNDKKEIAPLLIRKEGKDTPPPSMKASLEVSTADANRIRIFDKKDAGGKEIIGPSKGHKYDFPDLSFDEKEFGMEALTYAETGFDGEITITFTVVGSTGTTTDEKGVVRVAPWIMFTHNEKTEKVYVVETDDNSDFRNDLKGQVTGAGFPAPQQAAKGTYGSDRWMQDAMEPGFSSLPRSGGAKKDWNLPATLRTANNRSAMSWGLIDEYPKNELLGPDYGFTQAVAPTTGSSLDSFGNLECSPPFFHKKDKRDYKFGRIVYGQNTRKMHIKVRKFLKAQKVQDPFYINTDWLIVGHVDEVMSFLPLPSAPMKFKVMLASPERAMKIVNKAPGTAKLFEGINLTPGTSSLDITSKYTWPTVAAIKGDTTFKDWQKKAQDKIDDIKEKLSKELSLDKSRDFIDLPILFMKENGRYIACTAGVVNMLVLTTSASKVTLVIPKPFGPKVSGKCMFEKDVKAQLKLPGVSLDFVDDFTTYHMLYGEIHCGTNSQREPPDDRWWWELDWP